MNYKDQVMIFIKDELLEEELNINENTSLFEDRILDSLNLLNLISYMEDTFNIKIGITEVNIENFDSVKKIIEFLEGKIK